MNDKSKRSSGKRRRTTAKTASKRKSKRVGKGAAAPKDKYTRIADVMVRGGPSDCVRGALANAVRDVRSAELSNLYIKKNGIKLAMQYGVTPEILTASK